MTRIVTAHGLGDLINTDTVRGRTSYLVKGSGFEAWVDATEAHVLDHTAADGGGSEPLFSYEFTPDKQPLDEAAMMASGGGGTAGFGHVGSNPADRAGDTWAESRDRGDQQHKDYDEDPDNWEDPMQTGHLGDFWRWNDEKRHHASDNFDNPDGREVNEDNSTTLPWDPTPQYPVDMFTEQTIQPGEQEIDPDERLHPSDSRDFDSEDANRPYPGPDPKLFAAGTDYAEGIYADDFSPGEGSITTLSPPKIAEHD